MLLLLLACTYAPVPSDTDPTASDTDTEVEVSPCEGVWFTDAYGEETDVSEQLTGEASWADDGTLRFCAGTHTVQLTFTGNTLVLAGDGSDQSVLDGGGLAPVLTLASPAVVEVRDVTLTGGTAGIVGEAAVELTLTDAVVTANQDQSALATGIRLVGSLSMSGSTVSDNVSGGVFEDELDCAGAGLWVDGSITAENSAITGNISRCTVDASPYSYHQAEAAGVVASGNLSLHESTLADNRLELDVAGGFLTVRGGAAYVSGIVYATDSQLTDNVLDVTFTCGDAPYCALTSEGGVVLATRVELFDGAVRGNVHRVTHVEHEDRPVAETTVRGAALCASNVALEGTALTDNVLDDEGVDTTTEVLVGGAVFAGSAFVCEGASLLDNQAPEGGGVYWPGDADTFVSSDCDWGTAGTDDNVGGDVRGAAEHDVDGVASFTCDRDAGSCG